MPIYVLIVMKMARNVIQYGKTKMVVLGFFFHIRKWQIKENKTMVKFVENNVLSVSLKLKSVNIIINIYKKISLLVAKPIFTPMFM